MKTLHIPRFPTLLWFSLLIAACVCRAGVAFPEPPGGWTYLLQGDKAQAGAAGSGFTSLDGTWSHDNGSDEWDGSAVGGAFGDLNRPGGIGSIQEGTLNYLRIQDPGDPRDYGFADPGSNRKIYLGHDVSAKGGTETQLDDGITLTFRARIPTSGALDPLHRDGQQAAGVQPYPAAGDGYVTSDSGKGNFVLKQASGGAIAFSFTTRDDTAGGDPNGARANFTGLSMNEFAGNQVSANVNFGQGTGTNVIAFDPTQWHELWIVIRKDPSSVGTHQAFIYVDGSLTPTIFKITAGTGSDYSGITYLAMGSTATPQNSALDVDFVGYKLGVHFPPGFAEPAGGWTYVFNGDKAQPGEAGSGFTSLDGNWSHDNGSDEWDGSAPGGDLGAGNRPGGVGTFEESGTRYIRIQDTGDPRDYGFADPGSNRKIYLGHDMTAKGAAETQLDEGITLSFRARIPTAAKSSQPLDSLHRDGQQAAGVQPYPVAGDGYVTSDSGKGNFVLKQASGGAVAFSLTTTDDTPGGDPTVSKAGFKGLTMNEFAGNQISANVNFGQGTGTNVIAFDPTDWHAFWIVLRKDPSGVGTHQGFLYLDGDLTPSIFKITAGTGSDYSGITYLAIGSTATPQNSALDIDFIAYKLGAHFPGGAVDNLPPEILDVSPVVNATGHPAAQGITFKVTTQGANEIPPAGIRIVLNGQDAAGLSVGGTAKERTVTYSGLAANRFYQGEIIVADLAGRKSTNRVSFNTLVSSETTATEFLSYGSDTSVSLPAGQARLFLSAGGTEPQVLRVERMVQGAPSVVGLFRVPNTGGAAATQIVPLTDVDGRDVVIATGTGGATTFRVKPFGPGNSTPAELIVAPATDPATGRYVAFIEPLPGSTGVRPDTRIRLDIASGGSGVAPADIGLALDGADLKPGSTTGRSGSTTWIEYQPTAFFAGGSSHTAAYVYPNAAGSATPGLWTFVVGQLPTLAGSWATPAASVNGKPRGFTGRIHKARNDAPADLFANSPERAEAQLANKIIDPDLGQPFVNEAAGPKGDGSFVETATINFEQSGTDKGLPGDRAFPNLDAGDQNAIAMEVVTYLQLTRGSHRLAVACDDGFVVWAGPSIGQATNRVGIRSPGGSTAEAAFDVLAEQTGVYAFRLLFFEGNGGADVEWYSINHADGSRTLINDQGGLSAYQSRTGDGTAQPATPTPVPLRVTVSGGDLVISWDKTTPAFRLESTDSLNPAAWVNVTSAPVEQGSTVSVRVSPAGGTRFYRLAF